MLYLEKRLRSLECIVRYLDKHKMLEQVKQKTVEYRNSGDADQQMLVYIYCVYIDMAELFDMNVDLGNQILFTPIEGTILFQEVLYQYISDLHILPPFLTASQICIKLRIISLPTTIDVFHINKVSDLTRFSDYQGLVKLVGITTGISGQMKYTQSTKYICPDEQCDAHYSNQYIRMHIPGASETQTIRSDFKCRICGETLEEIKSMRMLSDQMIAEVIPVQLKRFGKREAFKSKMLQAIPIFLRDELVNYVEIGKTYEFIGICRTDFSGDEIIITLEIPQYQINKPMHEGLLPGTIRTIYKDAIVCGAVMIKLRLFLLISLALPPDENFLHLIVLGSGIELAQALMTFALQFSCYFPVSVTTPLYGKISNSRYPWVPYFIEGGSLFLSSGGICPVGDVGMLKKATRENLKAAMASRNILLELPHKSSESHTQPLSFPLPCHMWAHHDPLTTLTTKGATQPSKEFGGMFTGDLSKTFLDAFSVVCFVDGTDTCLMDEAVLIDFLQYEDNENCSSVSANDFEQYLDLARCMYTMFTQDAETLIHHYYNMSRMARNSELGSSNMPPSSLHALKSLACGLARLKLQEKVLESDAVLAIFLYEEQLTARYGISPLNIQCQSNLPYSRQECSFISENDLQLKQFYDKLLRFCSRSMDCPEE